MKNFFFKKKNNHIFKKNLISGGGGLFRASNDRGFLSEGKWAIQILNLKHTEQNNPRKASKNDSILYK